MVCFRQRAFAAVACLFFAATFYDLGFAQETGSNQPLNQQLPRISVSRSGKSFRADGKPFVVWGVNYDHDRDGRLIEDYWQADWHTVVEDFAEIKELGANTVRVHLQIAKFMESAERLNSTNLKRLRMLVELAEKTGLYLDITGLGCYHKQDVPDWYDAMGERQRWDVQARFWKAITNQCKTSTAVFCYNLMNEPILPGKTPETEWLAGAFGDKYFVQRITLDLAGRTREQVASQWVKRLTSAIREVDDQHLITVGVIPWAHVFPNAKPLFYAPQVCQPLDFVSVHFYPKTGETDAALKSLQVYEIGKPLVIEEIFPLKSSIEETADFIDRSRPFADGWISFYWGETADECDQKDDLAHKITSAWLKYFRSQRMAVLHQAP